MTATTNVLSFYIAKIEQLVCFCINMFLFVLIIM